MNILQPGKLVSLRGRDWIVLPSDDPDLLVVKPLGGGEDEVTGVYLPLAFEADAPKDARFLPPSPDDLGDISTARLLYDSSRLAFRNGAGPFRCLAKLSFRPRAYQMVPLIMALRLGEIRMLIADDVGVGKTVESLLIVRELLERGRIKRFAVVCLPHLCDQWQTEIREKLDIDAVVIRSNTQARLDRQIHGDTSVYEYYPYQVISIDFIKSDARRNVFIEQCPELVIVDEAHTCARPTGASLTQQQRYHLVSRIAEKPDQNLILLTATPHSGKPEEFQSLLGLIKRDFEAIDLPTSGPQQRRDLAKHFIQRKRSDVEKWMNEDTPFPQRDPFEWAYDLSPRYGQFFESLLDFAQKLVAPEVKGGTVKRVHYWTALALLRGAMSSPAAGVEMLNARMDGLKDRLDADAAEPDADEPNPVHDLELGFDIDNTPMQVFERENWTEYQKRQLRGFSEALSALGTFEHDLKLDSAKMIIEDWLKEGFNPVVFCRYIATANYVGELLAPALQKRFPKLDVQIITSEIPDDLRKQRVEQMGKSAQRLLIATDCLSEGINLQQQFTGVIHYDLPWNPNRIEQREGRVDRFGQTAKVVKACLLYGSDNPIDGIVLDVLLRKVREIKRATGINVPFPEDSQSIIDTITQALLLNPERKVHTRRNRHQVEFNFGDLPEAAKSKASVSRKIDEAAEREKVSRSIFAQNAIKAQEIEQDLREVDEAIGDPSDVESFVTRSLNNLFGVQTYQDREGWRIVTGNLPGQLREFLPIGETIQVSFKSPTPEDYYYIGRNNRFVEQLCQMVMANTLARQGKRAARTAVIRTTQVAIKTTILLFRCRNVIESNKGGAQVVAEEMVLWGWRGTPKEREYIGHTAAKNILLSAKASSDMSQQARASFVESELQTLDALKSEFDEVAERQSQRLVEAHERFSALMDAKRFQVVYPVLPMDLLGVYILLPENAQGGAR